MNSVCIIGRMTADVEVKKTNTDKSVCSFRVAVEAGKDKEAYFIPCTAWNKTAENIGKYFSKGDKIGIQGVLTSRSYEKDGKTITVLEVLVNSFDFCNGKKAEDQAQPQPSNVTVTAEDVAGAMAAQKALGGLPFEI